MSDHLSSSSSAFPISRVSSKNLSTSYPGLLPGANHGTIYMQNMCSTTEQLALPENALTTSHHVSQCRPIHDYSEIKTIKHGENSVGGHPAKISMLHRSRYATGVTYTCSIINSRINCRTSDYMLKATSLKNQGLCANRKLGC